MEAMSGIQFLRTRMAEWFSVLIPDDALNVLAETERLVVEMRFGVYGQPPMTFDQVSKAMGCTRRTVMRIQSEALKRLRTEVASELPVRCVGRLLRELGECPTRDLVRKEMSTAQLARIPGLGPKSLAAIECWLNAEEVSHADPR